MIGNSSEMEAQSSRGETKEPFGLFVSHIDASFNRDRRDFGRVFGVHPGESYPWDTNVESKRPAGIGLFLTKSRSTSHRGIVPIPLLVTQVGQHSNARNREPARAA